MNREQGQALLRSDRMAKTEDVTQGLMYRIKHLSQSDADDDDVDDTTVFVQLETYEGAYFYTSWPACPFELDYVSRINNGVLKCTMAYRTISETRVSGIIYIYR